MDPALVSILVLLSLGVLGFVLRRKSIKKAKELGAKKHWLALHMYGIPDLEEYVLANLYFTDDKLIIEAKKRRFELNYSQLTAIKPMTKTDLLKKDKSVIGRGVVGGVLLGPIGAIIGGMSAVGRQKNLKGNFLFINYYPSDKNGESEPKVIIFDMQKFSKAKELASFVQDKAPNLKEEQHVSL